jgi:putative salt-induced outer membrane protein
MLRLFMALAALLSLAAVGPAAARPPPKPVADMIAAAAGDPAALTAVVAAAKQTNPNSLAEIEAQVAALSRAPDKPAPSASAKSGSDWTTGGEVELGGFVSTGNTDENGVALGLKLSRATPRWRHGVEVIADHKRTNDATTKERYVGVYDIRYTLPARVYAWGRLSAERDRFAGFAARLSEGAGLGYHWITTPSLTFDVEGGPALRQTEYTSGPNRRSVAVRLATRFSWRLSGGATFGQTAATFLEPDNSTFIATTTLTTKLGGSISARASFDVRHDENPPNDRKKTDTTSRLTIVHDF